MDYVSEKKLALLIDAENISYKYISTIFDELKADWNITIKRIYGDFSKEQLSPWNDIVSQYALTQIQQLQTTSGKNSSDMALVINAMDILYRNNVDAFCIVSSDSDFSRLISRLKQEGKFTIGMGESKTSKALINCCDQFKYLNLLYDSTNDELNEENISLSDNKAEQEETELPQVVQTVQKQTTNGKKLKFKQQTDFVFQAESVLFLFEYDICCKS